MPLTETATSGRRWANLGLAVAAAVTLIAGAAGCNPIDRLLNPVKPGKPAGTADTEFHQTLFVADLHADTLATDRDFFAEDSNDGHVDLERLEEGNVSLQAFTVFTDTPFPRENGCVSGDDINFAALLQVIQLRPIDTWFSQKQRALYQARKLARLAKQTRTKREEGGGQAELTIIRTAQHVARVVERRRDKDPVVGGLLGLEGGHALDGNIGAVDEFFDAGFRMIALTHRFDNEFAGASEGCPPEDGLSLAGHDVVAAAASRRMILDLAHASSRTIQEVSAIALRDGYPVLISHGGVLATCPPKAGTAVARNITDSDMQAVARTGGVIGVGFWPEAVCWENTDDYDQARRIEAIVKAMAHIIDVLSEPTFAAEMIARYGRYDPTEHVALGSDYDGAVKVPFDVGDLGLLTTAMRDDRRKNGERRFSDDDIRNIAGINVCRLLATRLPEGSPELARETCDPLLVGLR